MRLQIRRALHFRISNWLIFEVCKITTLPQDENVSSNIRTSSILLKILYGLLVLYLKGIANSELLYVDNRGRVVILLTSKIIRFEILKGQCPADSVATTQVAFFAIFGNKLCKITEIFEGLDTIKSRWVLCQL
jgi:hypothetical protein